MDGQMGGWIDLEDIWNLLDFDLGVFVKGKHNLEGDWTTLQSFTFKQTNENFYRQFSQVTTTPGFLFAVRGNISSM